MNSPTFLYHYCSNRKCFSILNSKSLRMSDIQKSNDSRELKLFFPRLIHYIENQYMDHPFPFAYKQMTDVSAMLVMTRESINFWNYQFANGAFTNYVVCFSEKPDVLSQWRGYADDGKGCCIGFSKAQLDEYCLSHPSILRLEKVEYLTDEELDAHIYSAAKAALSFFSEQTDKALDEKKISNDNPEDDIQKRYCFDDILGTLFVDSLCLKSKGFVEEEEWRLFLKSPIHKNPDWFNCENMKTPGLPWLTDTISFMQDKLDYRETDNDLISFIPISFSEFPQSVVTQIWTGPKNMISGNDLDSFLKRNGYDNVVRFRSSIPYR